MTVRRSEPTETTAGATQVVFACVRDGGRSVIALVLDPGGQDQATVRRVITDIDSRVRILVSGLVPGTELRPSVVA
ncbi:MAG: hypothetical protein ACJ72A_20870 [Nocardioidaceae bacterium]